ncbi:TetR/AcrR family transcriptional regulator [Desulfatibacillum aliphaticivorans]|uniref:TetR/AcrR family transcriptional regulator n=1 Tax=Desulfatibacillum aliphaticivorans TaxID=218208 RepID=UPI000405E0A9|nr:TetR/AcrR family transcriptional regulator [Desulfatibacillum aliphaticivorans]
MSKEKQTRNAEATKAVILEAAEKLFAEKGFAGTSVREISQKAGVSGPLIMFHFKSKDGVYKAVKAAIVDRYAGSKRPVLDVGIPASEFLREFVEAMFAFYRDNPSMLRLSKWDNLAGEQDPWPGEDEWHHMYEEYFLQAQARGEIRTDLTPMNIFSFITGSAHVWWEYHDHFLRHEENQGRGGEADARFLNELTGFVLRGLSPGPGDLE